MASLMSREGSASQSSVDTESEGESGWSCEYRLRRGKLMGWLGKYGRQLGLTQSSVAAAQAYCDHFYLRSDYHSKTAKNHLVAMLLIASKALEARVLATSQAAYIFGLEPALLSELEQQVAETLSYHLCPYTYAESLADLAIGLKAETGL